jgi:gamma-glutamyltranspeptidase/glutathione hydrolase
MAVRHAAAELRRPDDADDPENARAVPDRPSLRRTVRWRRISSPETSWLAFADRTGIWRMTISSQCRARGRRRGVYLDERSRAIDPGRDMGEAHPGQPEPVAVAAASDSDRAEAGTSHLAIVDRRGNAVSMTMTIEQSFGAHIMAAGFVLNNELTDFALAPEEGIKVANRVEPGKRPRSSIAPMLVFRRMERCSRLSGRPAAAVIDFVAQALLALIDWGMTMQEAVALPHILNRNGATELRPAAAVRLAPARRDGHAVKIVPLAVWIRIVDRSWMAASTRAARLGDDSAR